MVRRLQLRSAAAKAAAQPTTATVRRGRPPAGGSSAVRSPPARRVPRELAALPWDFAQAEIGAAATDFLVLVLKVVLWYVQDQIEAQVIDST